MILGARLGESQPESKPKLSVGSRGGSPTDGNLAMGSHVAALLSLHLAVPGSYLKGRIVNRLKSCGTFSYGPNVLYCAL